LAALEKRLGETLNSRPRQLAWGDPARMTKSLEAVRACFGGHSGMARAQRILQGVMAFRLQGKNAEFLTLKYACMGLMQPMDDSRLLLEDEPLLETLLRAVEMLRPEPRRFRICLRALAGAWRQATQEGRTKTPACARNLDRLKHFLANATNGG
jgi:hypothetical protein